MSSTPTLRWLTPFLPSQVDDQAAVTKDIPYFCCCVVLTFILLYPSPAAVGLLLKFAGRMIRHPHPFCPGCMCLPALRNKIMHVSHECSIVFIFYVYKVFCNSRMWKEQATFFRPGEVSHRGLCLSDIQYHLDTIQGLQPPIKANRVQFLYCSLGMR